MTNVADQIYEEMVKISGPHAHYGTITKNYLGKDLYASYHFPTFTKLNAQRKTLVRFEEFQIPNDLSGLKVFDFGSNMGSLSFEAARRNAGPVVGFEFCGERVALCNKLAKYLGIQTRIQYIETNIDEESKNIDNFIKKYGVADITFCCALDAYVDKQRLYELVSKTTLKTCYFETNSLIPQDQFIEIMTKLGFKKITPIGSSKSDAGYGRISYILQK
ncbi:methyltransferase [Acanthamoeba polyphaga moumouvirus]|uniref:Methyltransferase n=1 Tax=Acanthamoeba polyphaga moumouvirus TaxID=1269028 RepID=L7RBQ1_9VIRU|nr:methyltransferase [Acanthamoeba polyphaga moumouvirus]AGC01607.1 methyltransferase [Acanthamoeba polyphaga moumouvirus]AQN67931.1 methyltransferase [Saudi moumouvirus]